jgi:ATP-dependent Lon protease
LATPISELGSQALVREVRFREYLRDLARLKEDQEGDEDEEEADEDEDEDGEDEDDDFDDSDDDDSDEDSDESTDSKEECKKNTRSKAKTEYDSSGNIIKKLKYTDTEIVDKLLEVANELKSNCKKNKVLDEIVKYGNDKKAKIEKREKKKDKKSKETNCVKYRQLAKDKNMGSDIVYFKKLSIGDQTKYLDEMSIISKEFNSNKPYRFALFDTPLPSNLKAIALKKINALQTMEPGSGEYYKIKNWVDTFMRIPFEQYSTLPIQMSDGTDKCHEFMRNAKDILDQEVYGLNDAKMQIMQMIGQWITNPSAVGTAIAIQGPMGTGKTTLVKEGISKIMNRYFAFIALGGATDSSFLEGHSYTYEGSTWGKIVDIMIQSKKMNPIIYFDELDKISDTGRGQEIVGILTHLTDTAQNTQFHDKYFADVEFNLSKCMFIFSYNDEEKVNPILRDRMYVIKTKGYNTKDKIIIANNYLLPTIREQLKFTSDDIEISEPVIRYIIEQYTNDEAGVRNLKRCLEIIYKKLNLYRLMKPDTNLFEEDMSIEVKFPFTVSISIIDILIKKTFVDDNKYNKVMYM